MILHILAVVGAVCIGCSLLLALFVVARIRRDRPQPPADDVMAIADALGLAEAQRLNTAETDLLVAAFPWARYSTWLKDPAPEERT